MRNVPLVLALIVGLSAACHPGPVIDTTPKRSVGGTIAGIVTTADSTVAVPGRKVTAIEVSSGSQFDATTGARCDRGGPDSPAGVLGAGGFQMELGVGTPARSNSAIRHKETRLRLPRSGVRQASPFQSGCPICPGWL